MRQVRYLSKTEGKNNETKIYGLIPEDKCYIEGYSNGMAKVFNVATDKYLGIFAGAYNEGGMYDTTIPQLKSGWYEAANKQFNFFPEEK